MAERQVIYGQEGGQTTALSTIDGILKEHYVLQNIVDMVNMKTFFLSQITMEKAQYGRRFVFPIRTGVGEGQGNRGENEQLPDPGFGHYDQAMGNVRFQYGSLYITGQAIEATEGGRASFASALKRALKDCRDGFTLETYRQSWGQEDGLLAKVNGAFTDKDVIKFKDPYGLTYSGTVSALEKYPLIRKSMSLLFRWVNDDDTIGSQIATVTGITGDGDLKLSGNVTVVDGANIYRGDAAASSTVVERSSRGKDYLGISEMTKTTGSYFGIPRDNEPAWQANIIEAGSAALDEDMLQNAFDTAEIYGDGVSEPNLLISNHKARRLYVALLQSQKRFVNTPMKLEGGFKALEYNGQPWVVDKLCPAERVYYLNTADMCWFYMKRIGWIQRDGTVLKWVDNRDAYRAVLATYRQLACKKPANQTVLEGITA